MVSLISINGTLNSMFDYASTEIPRSQGYKPVKTGKPIVIQYLYFFIKHKTNEANNELLISTFIKTEESKQAAAEAINFFDKSAVFKPKNQLELDDFGAQSYGHKLVYYSKSYLGESIYLTTKAIEIDKTKRDVIKAIQSGIGKVGALPLFAELLPFTSGIGVAVGMAGKLINLFNKDDRLISHDLDLVYNSQNVRHLQSGRIVCIQGTNDEKEILGSYKLTADNRLVSVSDGSNYEANSYFVLQIDSKKNKKLESFDYFMGAADLLKLTNSGEASTNMIDTVVEAVSGMSDIKAIQDIEELAIDVDDDPEAKLQAKALYKSLGTDARQLFEARYKNIMRLED